MIFIAKTFAGIEPILAQELEQLGATNVEQLTRAVQFEGAKDMLYRANLCCRTALRILQPYTLFDAPDEQTLYEEIGKIDWSKHFSLHQTFSINSTISHSNLSHTQFVSQKAKDAIVDQFRDNTGDRPNVDTESPDFRIDLHIHENRCTVSFDSSGDTLFKRGYRDYTNQAPLNESLAAALVLSSGWDKKQCLADFMCGSGTILIEAGLIARNIAPNKFRSSFGFQQWSDYDHELYKQVFAEAVAAEVSTPDLKLYGSDISGVVLDKAKQNIANAGLSDMIQLRKCSFDKFTPPCEGGMLICNPPYGLRIEADDILEMYKGFGDVFKQKMRGWTCWIFTGNLEIAKFIGLRPSRKIPLYNGSIECRFLRYDIYAGSLKASKQQKNTDTE